MCDFDKNDHDLLVTIAEQVKGIRDDMKKIDEMQIKLTETCENFGRHDERIEDLEENVSEIKHKNSTWEAISAIWSGINSLGMAILIYLGVK